MPGLGAMRCVLVRHGAPEIAPGLCYGRLDVTLTSQAAAETAPLALRLAAMGAGRVWSSPARRCRVLAEAVAAAGIPLVIDARLLELDFGAWEGLAWDAVPRPALDRWAADPETFAPPGGESGAALLGRVGAVWAALREAGQDAIVVSHGGPLRILLALAQGRTPDLLAPSPALGSVTVLPMPPPAHPAPRIP